MQAHPFESKFIQKNGKLELSSTGAVYPVLLTPESKEGETKHCMLFHFTIWAMGNPQITNYKVAVDVEVTASAVTRSYALPIWILFGAAKDKAAFTRWLKKYKSWFSGQDMHSAMFPGIPTSGRHSLTMLETSSGEMFDHATFGHEIPDENVERWGWAVQNSKHPVYVTSTGLAFVSSKDALYYKLKWSV